MEYDEQCCSTVFETPLHMYNSRCKSDDEIQLEQDGIRVKLGAEYVVGSVNASCLDRSDEITKFLRGHNDEVVALQQQQQQQDDNMTSEFQGPLVSIP
jgi:hypothetical protein